MALLIKTQHILEGDATMIVDLWKPINSVNIDQVGYVFMNADNYVLKTLCDGVERIYITEDERHLVFQTEPDYYTDQSRLIQERNLMQQNGYMTTSEFESWQTGREDLDIGMRWTDKKCVVGSVVIGDE